MRSYRFQVSTIALAAALIAPAAALAQAANATQSEASTTLDEVVITGTLIQHTDARSATPVTVLTAERLQDSGKVNLLDQLKSDPAIGTASRGSGFTIGGGGLQRVDLRNVGNTRTLVMINGHRYPFFSDIRGNSGQDISTIPDAFIGRVDVLRDGASALYGADAVAGVVNFITNDRFNGAEIDAYYGVSDEGDAVGKRLSAKVGSVFDKGSILVVASWKKQDALPQRDRDFATNLIGVGGLGAGSTLIGTLSGPGGRVTTASGALLACYPLAGGAAITVAANCPRYDTSGETSLLGGTEVRSLSSAIRYDLTDNIRFVLDTIYSERDSDQTVGAGSISSLSIPGSNSNNPYGQTAVVTLRMSDYGAKRFTGDNKLTFTTVGFDGELFGRFNWSLTQSYGKTDSGANTTGQIDVTSRNALFNPQTCAAIAACASVGPIANIADFLSKKTPLTTAQQQYLFYTESVDSRFTSSQSLATISGPIFQLPAGPLQVALGLERRVETGRLTPDAKSQAGASGSAIAPTSGRFTSKEAFAEVHAPLLKDVFLASSLEADLQYRYSDFSNFGSADVYKIGLNWSPIRDIRFRGSYGTSFRAPNILELFNGALQANSNLVDPCNNSPLRNTNVTVGSNCAALGVSSTFLQTAPTLPVLTGGNPNLKPERGRSYNLGVVVTPRQISNLTVTFDWWRLRIIDAIDNQLQNNLNNCYRDANFLTRAANANDICYTFADRNSDGSLVRVNSLATNFANLRTSGWDANVLYRLDDVLGGDWTSRLAMSHLDTYNSGNGNIAGTFNELVVGASQPRNRIREELAYIKGGYQLTGVVNFTSGMRDINRGSGFPVPNAKGYDGYTPDYYTYDLVAKARLTDRADLTVGVNNLFDKKPPYAYSSLYNTLISTYDVVGRYAFVDAKVRF